MEIFKAVNFRLISLYSFRMRRRKRPAGRPGEVPEAATQVEQRGGAEVGEGKRNLHNMFVTKFQNCCRKK